jgi:IclR family acetate operon transcriptional repressor
MTKTSPYAVNSVDNALRLILMLDSGGPTRLTTLADELGVARSTAHRLLTTLVHRGFAVQGDDKTYGPGPVLSRGPVGKVTPAQLRATARPSLEWLNGKLQETVHLIVRRGRQALFVDSVESAQALRVGSRTGAVMPAHLTSGGQALLSLLSSDDIAALYAKPTAGDAFAVTDLAALGRTLAETRRRGYGLNVGGTEPGLTAVGRWVLGNDGAPLAAVTVSAPSARLPKARIPEVVGPLREAIGRLEADL